MASLVSISSPPLPLYGPPPPSSSLRCTLSLPQLESCWARRLLGLRVKCTPDRSGDVEPEAESTSVSSTATSTSTSISSYYWCSGLGALGFLETGYLTFLKLTNSDAFCPIGGGTCGDVLNSDYAVVFGVPLSLIGMFAYGLVASLGIQFAGQNMPFGISESNGRLILLGTTTSMAVASGYFLYILGTKFAGVSCSYCLLSALLSISLFFITLKDFWPQEIQKVVGIQLGIAGLVLAALTTSYNISPPPASFAGTDLPFFTTTITTESSTFAISLAKHLKSIGAKMYGAFWCSHCLEQKQMFGQEAAKLLDYVECFPEGYRKGVKIAKACADAGIEGFPTWVINDQVFSGELELSELAKASGLEFEDSSQSN